MITITLMVLTTVMMINDNETDNFLVVGIVGVVVHCTLKEQ